MNHWVWQQANWPNFTWDKGILAPHIAEARLNQGKLVNIVKTLTEDIEEKLSIITLAEQAINTSAIEGEILNRDSVKSAIYIKFGLDSTIINKPTDYHIESLLDMLLDATGNYQTNLTTQRLFGWHAALFPTGYSGLYKIKVAQFRGAGPMLIISGKAGKEVTHYEAPPYNELNDNIKKYLEWFNQRTEIDGIVRAGVAHVWFELIHPFADGNGRIGRAICDLALAQDEKLTTRYYSLSATIMQKRKEYYAQLKKCCTGNLDITEWLIWFINCFNLSVLTAIELIDNINSKSKFWQQHAATILNARQIKALNKLLDSGKEGYIGHMTTRKYMHINRVSRATAYRELNDLVTKHCLRTTTSKGRSAGYVIDWGN